ncbi:hypothetical protein [Nocardioides sp. GXQ0305]|uniref:hypothetical protein n=1 Tax=Nocardioides sp. GXQ0305 TaxID=3423912 RepID=UPI003D7EB2A2
MRVGGRSATAVDESLREVGTVQVFSRFDLVAHTVTIGLASRGLTAARAGRRAGVGADLRPGDVAVLIDDLDGEAAVRWACDLVQHQGVPWLVLTAAPPGPVWDALLRSGADTAILPSTTSLDEVEAALVVLLRGSERVVRC